MSSAKRLQRAAIKFRKENPALYATYSAMLSKMANFITEYGVAETTVRK